MTRNQLIPKAPKRKRQPSAQLMREQLALAADRIIDLETRLDDYTRRRNWWERLFNPAPARYLMWRINRHDIA